MERLIKSSLTGNLKNEEVPLDFTTRSIYVEDAVSLCLKAMMHGGTTHKIYDGSLFLPIKINEIKQILLDPLWYESNNIQPTILPAWTTPNLETTKKELNWQAKVPLIKGLRETLNYFTERQELVSELKEVSKPLKIIEEEEIVPKQPEKVWIEVDEKKGSKTITKEPQKEPSFNQLTVWAKQLIRIVGFSLGTTLIAYAIFFPIISSLWRIANIPSNLNRSQNLILENDFTKAEEMLDQSAKGVGELNKFKKTIKLLENLPVVQKQVAFGIQTIEGIELLALGLQENILGAKNFNLAVRTMAGEQGEIKEYIQESQSHFNQSQNMLTKAISAFHNNQFIPEYASPLFNSWKEMSQKTQQAAFSGYTLSRLVERLSLAAGKVNYILVLQDNASIKPTGGQIRAVALLTFEKGKFSSLEAYTIEELDKKLTEKVEPPTELKTDFNLSKWNLQYANSEADFAASAKMMSWFFLKETGIPVQGVVTIDFTALEEIIAQTGPVTISSTQITFDQKKVIEDRLTIKDNRVWSEIFKQSLMKMIFLPKMSGPKLGSVLEDNLQNKHILIYLADPLSENMVSLMNWSGTFPKAEKEIVGERGEVLALVGTNLLNNLADYYLQKKISLTTNISKEGNLSHQLKVLFNNQYSGDSALAGTVKWRLKVYLSSGSRLSKATFDGRDISKEVTSFSDYGRAGYAMILQIDPQKELPLELEFISLRPLAWKQDKVNYQLQVYKQPGTKDDRFSYELSLPSDFQVQSQDLQPQSLGVYSTSQALDTDLRYNVLLQKKKKLSVDLSAMV